MKAIDKPVSVSSLLVRLYGVKSITFLFYLATLILLFKCSFAIGLGIRYLPFLGVVRVLRLFSYPANSTGLGCNTVSVLGRKALA